MRQRNGKGLTFAIDAKIEIFVEAWRREKGYYPALREISENFDPPRSVGMVYHHLRRLSAAGKLTPEAELIYNSKKKQENTNDKTGKDAKTTSRAKTGQK